MPYYWSDNPPAMPPSKSRRKANRQAKSLKAVATRVRKAAKAKPRKATKAKSRRVAKR